VLCHVGTLVSFVRFVASEPSLGTRRRRTAAVAGNTLAADALVVTTERRTNGADTLSLTETVLIWYKV